MSGAGDRIATRAVHAGHDPAAHQGAAVPPTYASATFVASDTETLEALNDGRARGFVYSRVRNPTVFAAEQRLAAVEGAESVVLFASGMAAISGALMPFLRAGDEVVATPDLYGGTARLFAEVLPLQGITIRWADSLAPDAVAAAMTPATKAIYAETPTNPLLRLVDLAALSAVAKRQGALLIVDGTLGGPLNQDPLSLGVDLLVQSVSKYLNGHADVLGGAVAGSRALTRKVRSLQQAAGAIMDPHAAQLLMRGVATYPLRMARHNASGQRIAGWLAGHPKIARVHYPGLSDHPDHALALRQMTGFGGLISFDCGSDAAARRVVDRTRLFGIGASLGGIESLISQPGNTSHHSVQPARRAEMGITPGLVRISVGIEDADDLIADLEQALEQA
ncbi:PLP-dependent aspartate aminotransferase family protein [Frigidibacter sp. MR17.14]|uniref:trans-sulfuration enzyme family protein n=1 Tax=Frigidibacter sp. MR17.14 TaxID=3126509 RepID=UPI003012A0A3